MNITMLYKNKCIRFIFLFTIIIFTAIIIVNVFITKKKNDINTVQNFNIDENSFSTFSCSSYEEIVNKLNYGDIRSIDKTHNDDKKWETSCKDFFCKWYNVGKIPVIKGLENRMVYTYEFCENMLCASYYTEIENPTDYYEIITLSDDLDTREKKDVEYLYAHTLKGQGENIASEGGEYKDIIINSNMVKSAVCNYDDGSKSIDFIWNGKYLVKLWDKEEKIDLLLLNFDVNETKIERPDNFYDKNDDDKNSIIDRAYVNKEAEKRERIKCGGIKELRSRIQSSVSKTDSADIEQLYKQTIPEINFSNNIGDKYELIEVNLLPQGINNNWCVEYVYNNINENVPISIIVSPDCYSDSNKSIIEDLKERLNSSNPYRYDEEYLKKYGVLTELKDNNIEFYLVDNIYNNGSEKNCLIYKKDGALFSELCFITDGHIVDISQKKENNIEELKKLGSSIVVEERIY